MDPIASKDWQCMLVNFEFLISLMPVVKGFTNDSVEMGSLWISGSDS